MTEIYKSMNHLNPSIISEFYEMNHVTYNLRIQNLCKLMRHRIIGKNHCPLEGAYFGIPLMTVLKMNQPLRLSIRRSQTGLVINAPTNCTANFFL